MKKLIFTDCYLGESNNVQIIVDNAVCNDYLDNSLVHHISDFSEKYPNPNYYPENLHKLQELADIKLENNKSSKEILSINGKSAWYLLEYLLFYEFKQWNDNPSFSRIMYMVQNIKKVQITYPDLVYENKVKDKHLRHIVNVVLGYPNTRSIPLNKNLHFLHRIYLRYRLLRRRYQGDKNIPSSQILFFGSSRSHVDNLSEHKIYGDIFKKIQREGLDYSLIESDLLYTRSKPIENNPPLFSLSGYYDDVYSQYYNEYYNFIDTALQNIIESKIFRDGLKKIVGDNDIFIFNRLKNIKSVLIIFLADLLALGKRICDRSEGIFFVEHSESYIAKALAIHKNHRQKIISLSTEIIYPSGCLARHSSSADVSMRPLPDQILVPGRFAFNVLIKNCMVPREKIIITGSQVSKLLYQKSKSVEILFAGSGVKKDKSVLEELIDLVQKDENIILNIKIHPLSTPRDYKNLLQNKVRVNLHKDNFDGLLSRCHLFISVRSTTTIVAIANQIPALIIDMVKCPMPYIEFDAVYSCNKKELIKSTIYECLKASPKDNSKFIKEYCNNLVNESADVSLRLIKEFHHKD